MTGRAATALLVAIALPLQSSAAQSGPLWRTVEVARQLRDTLPQRVRVQYGAGRIDVRPTSDSLLYQMRLRYDETRAVAVHRYDAKERSVVLGLESLGRGLRSSGSGERNDAGELVLALPRRVPLDLDLKLGGTQSMLELGGLALRSLRLKCGAADATLQFTTANSGRMRELDVDVGAADFSATNLANANAEQIRVRGGIGVLDLDFGGTWTRDLEVSTQLGAGKLILRIPSDVGVRLEVERLLAGLEHDGFVKRDDAWYSANFQDATHKLNVRAETFVGQIEIRHRSR